MGPLIIARTRVHTPRTHHLEPCALLVGAPAATTVWTRPAVDRQSLPPGAFRGRSKKAGSHHVG